LYFSSLLPNNGTDISLRNHYVGHIEKLPANFLLGQTDYHRHIFSIERDEELQKRVELQGIDLLYS